VKVGGPGDLDRLRAVREGAPGARLVVDANEGWTEADLVAIAPEIVELGVEVVEQPLPAAADAALAGLELPIVVCADESFHTSADVARVGDRYGAVNIKLDKTGGLTEALRAVAAARDAGLQIMVGCMVSTSLSIAPALLLAGRADWVDLDGALLLARDRAPDERWGGLPLDPARWLRGVGASR
jgi:L-alanine-DL-glutamate epimerase-like enolase superfamily enzyme